jgi:YVTN family beta-propeller protein
MVFDAQPPFAVLQRLDTGPITNHVNFARTRDGQFAYVTVGGSNEVQVFDTKDFSKVATIPVGKLPHGVWPSGDGTRIYVGLENDDALAAIDAASNKVIATIPIGQAPQAITYVPNAVPEGDGTTGLVPLGVAAKAAHFTLMSAGKKAEKSPTNVTLFDQGVVQVLQAAVTGLEPKASYVLALAADESGKGTLAPLQAFVTNPVGAAIVNSVGPVRQIVQSAAKTERRYLVIAKGTAEKPGEVVQVQEP